MYNWKIGRSEDLGAPGEAFVKALKVIIKTVLASSPKLNSLEAEKTNATLGVSSDVLRSFLESRKEAARVNGPVCPMCVEDLKWGID